MNQLFDLNRSQTSLQDQKINKNRQVLVPTGDLRLRHDMDGPGAASKSLEARGRHPQRVYLLCSAVLKERKIKYNKFYKFIYFYKSKHIKLFSGGENI